DQPRERACIFFCVSACVGLNPGITGRRAVDDELLRHRPQGGRSYEGLADPAHTRRNGPLFPFRPTFCWGCLLPRCCRFVRRFLRTGLIGLSLGCRSFRRGGGLLVWRIGSSRIGGLLRMPDDRRPRNPWKPAYAGQSERPPPLETCSYHCLL